jgi:Cof subfamily protein (haloacid dehalogenase superfamily)
MTRFKLLALDVDGTLVGPDGVVGPDIRAAVAAARAAGLAVCLATGRSYRESRGVWEQLRLEGPHEPMVTVGGAMVCQSDTGRTLYHRSMPRSVARRLGSAMNDRGYVAMALVDGWRNAVDYLVTQGGDHHAAGRDWFSKMAVRIKKVASLADAPADMAILRISTVVEDAEARRMAAELSRQFAGQLNVHAILAPNYGVTVVEAHAVGADKMTALRYVAQPMRVGAGLIAAVGDDVNDMPMVRGAGLGAAMGHAPDALKAAADVIVNDGSGDGRPGLADFIRRLVAGEYDRLM